MIFDKIIEENVTDDIIKNLHTSYMNQNKFMYGIELEIKKRKKGDKIEFYKIEKFDLKKQSDYHFYIATHSPLIEKPIIRNREENPDTTYIWTDNPEKLDDAHLKQMQWHYERIIGLSNIDYDISSLTINPHGIFFYSLGSKLYVNDTKVSCYEFKDSKIVEQNVYWQFDPYNYDFIRKYEI